MTVRGRPGVPGWYPADELGYYEVWWTGRDWSGHTRSSYSRRPVRAGGGRTAVTVVAWLLFWPLLGLWATLQPRHR